MHMLFAISLVFAATFVLVDGLVSHARLANLRPHAESFAVFVQTHGRNYAMDSKEYSERLSLFSSNLEKVRQLNRRPSRSWKAGINHFADWRADELKQLFGWKRGASSSDNSARHKLLLSQTDSEALPAEFLNWTTLSSLQTIRDQGGCGSCWAVSSAVMLEAHVEISSGRQKSFSPQELIDCVRNPHHCGGSGGCQGATSELALQYITLHGLAEESLAPYQGRNSICPTAREMLQLGASDKSSGFETVEKQMAHYGMLGWERLPENKYHPLLRAVVEHGPAVVSVDASQWTYYESGIFDGCSKDSIVNHAVVLVGYGSEPLKYWLIQNSWGPIFGEAGRIRLLRSEEEYCGVDTNPKEGTACDGGPARVKVCGMCGILYDTTVLHFKRK